jgi:hypothetical protein
MLAAERRDKTPGLGLLWPQSPNCLLPDAAFSNLIATRESFLGQLVALAWRCRFIIHLDTPCPRSQCVP